jgi:hypothetical protein
MARKDLFYGVMQRQKRAEVPVFKNTSFAKYHHNEVQLLTWTGHQYYNFLGWNILEESKKSHLYMEQTSWTWNRPIVFTSSQVLSLFPLQHRATVKITLAMETIHDEVMSDTVHLIDLGGRHAYTPFG